MGDEREGRRRSLMGAGPLLGQLHSLPSVEAEREMQINKQVITFYVHYVFYVHSMYSVVIDKDVYTANYSPCVGAEAVKGQTGSKE